MALDPLAERLRELLELGFVVRSRVTAPMRERLAPLFHLGVLGEERSGAGRRITLHDHVALEQWIRTHYPSGLFGVSGDLGHRAESVANFRDSKRAGLLAVSLVYLRGFGRTELRRRGAVLRLADMTRAYGVVGLAVDPRDAWEISGTVALVENLECFLNVEHLIPHADAALYTAGRIDGRVLQWLAEQENVRALHAGDYDPVGLDEYLKVRAAFGDRADLFIPNGFEERVAKYGQPELLTRSLPVYRRVRLHADERVKAVLNVLDRHGRGLEQEALLITDDEATLLESSADIYLRSSHAEKEEA